MAFFYQHIAHIGAGFDVAGGHRNWATEL